MSAGDARASGGSGGGLRGKTLAGRYTLGDVIGQGGMATVYRAAQDSEPREVAVKILNEDLSTNKEIQRRFRREAKAATRLVHPSTVRTLDYGVDGEHLYIVMELAGGRDLFDLLAVQRRLPEARAARIMIEVCDGLSAAHAQGIIHRDLKPENVMVGDPDASGSMGVKVLDFGIAKMLEEPPPPAPKNGDLDTGPISRSVLTRVGVIVGTPEYVSPEQGRAEAVDARSDVYACGVVLYQMVTGKVPFGDGTPLQLVMRHVREAPRPPSELSPGLHPGLEAIILKALAKFPAERHQTALELKAALVALLPRLSDQREPGAVLPESARGAKDVIVSVPSSTLRMDPNGPASSHAVTLPSIAVGSPALPEIEVEGDITTGRLARQLPPKEPLPEPDLDDDEARTHVVPDAAKRPLRALPTLRTAIDAEGPRPPVAPVQVEVIEAPPSDGLQPRRRFLQTERMQIPVVPPDPDGTTPYSVGPVLGGAPLALPALEPSTAEAALAALPAPSPLPAPIVPPRPEPSLAAVEPPQGMRLSGPEAIVVGGLVALIVLGALVGLWLTLGH